jgi:hypothetical protein
MQQVILKLLQFNGELCVLDNQLCLQLLKIWPLLVDNSGQKLVF